MFGYIMYHKHMTAKGKNVMLSASYIVGLVEGEGNKNLLLKVRKYFQVGSVYQKSTRAGRLPAYVFEVTKRDDIYNIIIPFFKKHRLFGIKRKSFDTFSKISVIVKGRQDIRKLNSKELAYISKLKRGMNKHYGSLSAGKPLA
jgi:hypothetical protein